MVLPPLTMSSVFTQWTIDPVAAVLIVASTFAYFVGVRRLAARGRSWSRWRSTSMAIGLVTLAIATQSGVATYDAVLFSVHVIQHIMVGIVAPFFIALSAPVTLALQAAHRPAQVRLAKVLHSSPVRHLSHPVVVFALFAFSLFALYFTPIYELSLRNGLVHAAVHLHFVAVGSLFFWVLIGLDPVAHRLPYGARLVMVLMTVFFHAFLGVAIMSSTQPLAAAYYAEQPRNGQPPVLDDQRTGGGLMWTVGDLVGLAAGGVIAVQWFRHEERRTRHLDRILDRQG